ncbi:hypothetical protein [Halovenus salina]|uniref:Uncharacterized protein n=1 Tax=Halovenus salina TaxID=1510225 RepID=A0ABD5W379_9EURY
MPASGVAEVFEIPQRVVIVLPWALTGPTGELCLPTVVVDELLEAVWNHVLADARARNILAAKE